MSHRISAGKLITVANPSIFQFSGDFTIYLWFDGAVFSSSWLYAPFAKWGSAGGRSYTIDATTSGSNNGFFRFVISTDGTSWSKVLSDDTGTDFGGDTDWKFLAVTFEASTEMNIYVGKVPGSITLEATTTSSVPAAAYDGGNAFFVGSDGVKLPLQANYKILGVLDTVATKEQLEELSWGRHPVEMFGSNAIGFYRFWSDSYTDPEPNLVENDDPLDYQAVDWTEAEGMYVMPSNILATARPTAAITTPGDAFDATKQLLEPFRCDPDRTQPAAVPYRFGA